MYVNVLDNDGKIWMGKRGLYRPVPREEVVNEIKLTLEREVIAVAKSQN